MAALHRVLGGVAALAIAIWLGGLVALGAIVAPVAASVVTDFNNAYSSVPS